MVKNTFLIRPARLAAALVVLVLLAPFNPVAAQDVSPAATTATQTMPSASWDPNTRANVELPAEAPSTMPPLRVGVIGIIGRREDASSAEVE